METCLIFFKIDIVHPPTSPTTLSGIKFRRMPFRNQIARMDKMSEGPLATALSRAENPRQTSVLPISWSRLGHFRFTGPNKSFLDDWSLVLDASTPDAMHLVQAAEKLRSTDVPVAFPTETVYGLGADATRSSAVLGIYKAKQRPADNPLIVHVSSLQQLRHLLQPAVDLASHTPLYENTGDHDPIPAIYFPLIQCFWPGPLTLLLSNPPNSALAPEVTAGLPTFGARMPSSILALSLIKVTDRPLAAPSANASTKPSPTTAEHVKYDLDGRIDIILDGGPCEVGVESTVVDGLSNPPSILRPGGISIDQLRECEGWENVVLGYMDKSQTGQTPRAPGMKYRHYSPKAKVILVETSVEINRHDEIITRNILRDNVRTVGILRTKWWKFGQFGGFSPDEENLRANQKVEESNGAEIKTNSLINESLSISPTLQPPLVPKAQHWLHTGIAISQDMISVWDIGLGESTASIARTLFSGLRELDQKGVDVIFVEGIEDNGDGAAAAVMNRLRKAAEVDIKS